MSISDLEWDALIVALRNVDESDQAAAAAQKLYQTATIDDMPRLMRLLQDPDAFVREAAAWPVSELGGELLLRDLLIAYQRGLEEGLDNDGFSAALIELVEDRPVASASKLRSLAQDPDSRIRENAFWLLEFCAGS